LSKIFTSILEDPSLKRTYTINPFTLAPWEKRVQTTADESAARQADTGWAIRIAVSSSARNDVVGIGGAIQLSESVQGGSRLGTFSSTLGMRSEQNLYSGELAAIARALSLLPKLRFRSIVLLTSNRAAVLTLRQPRQQSGQEHVRHIYESIRTLRKNGNVMTIMWTPSSEENELLKIAKEKAREATQRGAIPQTQTPRMQSTTLNVARSKLGTSKSLPEKVGKYSKRVDAALPGKHTRRLYHQLSWKEASVLAQLRTGMARLNAYLYRIKVATTDQCACRQARETVRHFIFQCRQWTAHRTEMLQCTDTHRGNISFYLGGKSPLDDQKWTPNLEAVRATIRFAIATGRLEAV